MALIKLEKNPDTVLEKLFTETKSSDYVDGWESLGWFSVKLNNKIENLGADKERLGYDEVLTI